MLYANITPLLGEKEKASTAPEQVSGHWVLALALFLPHCVPLDQSCPLSGPQSLPWSNEVVPGANIWVSSSFSTSIQGAEVSEYSATCLGRSWGRTCRLGRLGMVLSLEKEPRRN